ncbi:MAG: adenylate kinase family protein [Methanomicrobia archaeon]|nr:adenylate kinase family protein [Methanomicrobia archaeon]
MIIGITGTPGTGKTSVCRSGAVACLDLTSVVETKGFYTGVDPDRGSLIADLERLGDYVRRKEAAANGSVLVIEGHLAHLLKPAVAIVLRTHPHALVARLTRKGFSTRKIQENLEAEVLDLILAEAVELCETVYEVDTSGRSVAEVASVVRTIIAAETEEGAERGRSAALRERYKPGSVDWSDCIEEICLQSSRCGSNE